MVLPRTRPCPPEGRALSSGGRAPALGRAKTASPQKTFRTKIQGDADMPASPWVSSLKKLYYKAKSEPGLNFTTFFAGISKVSPVRGFLPVRAGRSAGANVPKPTSATLSPALTAFAMAAVVAFKALAASAFVKPASAAMALIKSVLFIISVIKWLMNGPVLGLWIFL